MEFNESTIERVINGLELIADRESEFLPGQIELKRLSSEIIMTLAWYTLLLPEQEQRKITITGYEYLKQMDLCCGLLDLLAKALKNNLPFLSYLRNNNDFDGLLGQIAQESIDIIGKSKNIDDKYLITWGSSFLLCHNILINDLFAHDFREVGAASLNKNEALDKNNQPVGNPKIKQLEKSVYSQDYNIPINYRLVISNSTATLICSTHESFLHWNISSGRFLGNFNQDLTDNYNLSISNSGEVLYAASDNEMFHTWDLVSHQLINKFPLLRNPIFGLLITPEETRAIVSGGYDTDSKIDIFDIRNGTCIYTLEGHKDIIVKILLSIDGSNLFSISHDNTFKIWDNKNGMCIESFNIGTGGLYQKPSCMALTPDGKYAIIGSEGPNALINKNGLLVIWDIRKKGCKGILKGHTRSITSIAISSDGRRLLSTSTDSTIKLWDLTELKCIASLEGNQDEIIAARFSFDENIAISISKENAIKLWDINAGLCLDNIIIPEGIRDISETSSENHFAIITKNGQVRIFEIINYTNHIPIITATRICRYNNASYNGIWDDQISFICKYCNTRSILSNELYQLIMMINKKFDIDFKKISCLELPQKIWCEVDLISECLQCHKSLKFNPFIVDNRVM
jgi:WD40 repeat protein